MHKIHQQQLPTVVNSSFFFSVANRIIWIITAIAVVISVTF